MEAIMDLSNSELNWSVQHIITDTSYVVMEVTKQIGCSYANVLGNTDYQHIMRKRHFIVAPHFTMTGKIRVVQMDVL
jgi:hypothetical protein